MKSIPVICVPGSVAPASQRYAPLKEKLGVQAQVHLKDLEVYASETPAADYSVELELAALDRFADDAGIDRFHLVGYSGGGFLSIAYAGTRSRRLASLALFEPAMVPGLITPEEGERYSEYERTLGGLDGHQFMSAFVGMQLKAGVPVPAAPAPWPGMNKRPAGIAVMMRSFREYGFDRRSLADGSFPVYLAYGDLTHEFEEVKVAVLARHFPDIWVQRFAGVHHFVPPSQIYTDAHVESLRELWRRAEDPIRNRASSHKPALQQ